VVSEHGIAYDYVYIKTQKYWFFTRAGLSPLSCILDVRNSKKVYALNFLKIGKPLSKLEYF